MGDSEEENNPSKDYNGIIHCRGQCVITRCDDPDLDDRAAYVDNNKDGDVKTAKGEEDVKVANQEENIKAANEDEDKAAKEDEDVVFNGVVFNGIVTVENGMQKKNAKIKINHDNSTITVSFMEPFFITAGPEYDIILQCPISKWKILLYIVFFLEKAQ